MRFPKLPRLWRAGPGSPENTNTPTPSPKKRPGLRLPVPGRRILAVEMAGDDIRAAVVRGRGRSFEIIDYATLKRPDTKEDLPDVASLKALAERLGVGGGPAILVSPLARAFELLMDRAKIKGMKPHQLAEAVKWEVEPYTGITGASALIAVERKAEAKAKPGEVVYDDDDQTTVNVAAIERNVYRALKERFKVAGFRLVRIYPPEASFYYVLHMDGRDTPRAVLEVGQDYSNFAVLSGGIPQQINTLSLSQESIVAHVSGELISQDLVDTLRFTVRQVPEPEPLVLTGLGAADKEVSDFIAEFCTHGAVPLDLPRTAGLADAKGDPTHAVYGTVVGAALRELRGGRERQAGIDDTIPLAVQIRRSAYLAPVAITALLVLSLAGHYFFMRYKEEDYKAQIVKHQQDLKERKEAMARYESLSKELEKINGEIDQAQKRIDYMQNTADKNLTRLILALREMGLAAPDQVSLESVVQDGPNKFRIKGSALNPKAPGLYAASLQERHWCESAVLDGIASETGGGAKKAAVGKAQAKPRNATGGKGATRDKANAGQTLSEEWFQFELTVNIARGT